MRGNGTTLISLYIPAQSSYVDCLNFLKKEYASSLNIQSKKVRNNVQSGLKSIQQRLRKNNTIPKLGLVFFAGFAEYSL
jgi:peptide subunit release factor 1 (eRF1)